MGESLRYLALWLAVCAWSAVPIAALAAAGGLAVESIIGATGEVWAPDEALARNAVTRAGRLLENGDARRAIELLSLAMSDVEQSDNPRLRAVANALLGRAYLQAGYLDLAEPRLKRATDIAEKASLTDLEAAALNDLGLVHAARHDELDALSDFSAALQEAPAPELAMRIRLNAADVHHRRGEDRAAHELLQQASALLDQVPASPQKVLLSTAMTERLVSVAAGGDAAADRAHAQRVLEAALSDAVRLSDERGKSQVLGAMADLQAADGGNKQALKTTQRAIFAAQAAQAPELLYRWEWQAARLQAALGNSEQALAYYRRAAADLQPIRHDVLLELTAERKSYRDTVGPLFLQFADLLLQRSGAAADAVSARRQLREARDVVEQLKTVELEDYFHDDCVTEFEAKQHSIDQVAPKTAVIYPVILPDRLELLVSIGADIERHTVAVSGSVLAEEALAFRKQLERRGSDDYLPYAQHLHAWLIAPLLGEFAAKGVETLVVIPDGPLLGIPFAALHDGHDFLVQRYAIATVPALRLTEPSAARKLAGRALVNGLTDSVQGFPALPRVGEEIQDVGKLYDTMLLDNRDFTESNVEKAVKASPYSVVHIASHGTFDNDPKKTFLLTYDGKIGIDQLERIVKFGHGREDPVDLLTLSACQTAAGDERAALGLAGVAIKAGARSVLASLWSINDEASSALIRDFYHELADGKQSKAKALQAAQLHLLAEPQYHHPDFWAPFLLIGNWE